MTYATGNIKKFYAHQWPRQGTNLIHFFPHSLEELTIDRCEQRYAVSTRCLPRSLISLHMNHNNLNGTFDLQSLPKKLAKLDMSFNHLRGKVILMNLPETLEWMDMRFNIFNETVYVGDIPVKTEQINLRKCGIRKAKALVKEGKVDTRVLFLPHHADISTQNT
eukprot:CAMPEP_0201507030 /NCGR_PEP_ID=MMETSP0161_2-20130828/835_1 /ASSEMBLY_ACC=CAM_ASM_000251 /TAXON_ID=180227 /ORGANISM="Neoparamoeba aestuarina, Strain SoJaBio B1-5/56/2" /LENGTH=163 /DNA_ID=CAMNT_0047901299 /DNA_START=577 /DNA_END=1071 /DNA_ORIENTATION=-